MARSLEPDTLSRLLPGVSRGEEEAVDRWYRGELPVVYRLAFGFSAVAGRHANQFSAITETSISRRIDMGGSYFILGL